MAPGEVISPDVESIVSSIEILGQSSYRIDSDLREIGSELPLVNALATDIYQRLFTRLEVPPEREIDEEARRGHQRRIAAANSCRGTWQSGWRIVGERATGEIQVERWGVTFTLAAREVRVGDQGPVLGQSCRVRVPGEMRALAPDYYLALGDAESAEVDDRHFLARLYWHLRAEAAAPWIEVVTKRLNQAEIPFRLKVLRFPEHYRRADAGVLVLEPRHYDVAAPAIEAAYRRVRAELRTATPLMTARLAPGLAVAEGPADGRSFGELRCDLIAQALVEAGDNGPRDRKKRSESVAAAFRDSGLDPLNPHLAPRSVSCYQPLVGANGRVLT